MKQRKATEQKRDHSAVADINFLCVSENIFLRESSMNSPDIMVLVCTQFVIKSEVTRHHCVYYASSELCADISKII
jgi:hypothetical protein